MYPEPELWLGLVPVYLALHTLHKYVRLLFMYSTSHMLFQIKLGVIFHFVKKERSYFQEFLCFLHVAWRGYKKII